MPRTMRRRLSFIATIAIMAILAATHQWVLSEVTPGGAEVKSSVELVELYNEAHDKLAQLEVKGRAPKTGYSRENFGNGWSDQGGCSMRNIILNRDLREVEFDDQCQVRSGVLEDPYSGEAIKFERGADSSSQVQIDHVVALSDAWQKGAQQLSYSRRVSFHNDPLNLLAVSGESNHAKSDSDAASWLPPNKAFRCQYVSRQVAVKYKYQLWVTSAEKSVIERLLSECRHAK